MRGCSEGRGSGGNPSRLNRARHAVLAAPTEWDDQMQGVGWNLAHSVQRLGEEGRGGGGGSGDGPKSRSSGPPFAPLAVQLLKMTVGPLRDVDRSPKRQQFRHLKAGEAGGREVGMHEVCGSKEETGRRQTHGQEQTYG